MPDLAVHLWKDPEIADFFRLEFQQIGKDDSFFFDLTGESLRRLLMTVADFENTSEPGQYAQFAFDLSEEGETE